MTHIDGNKRSMVGAVVYATAPLPPHQPSPYPDPPLPPDIPRYDSTPADDRAAQNAFAAVQAVAA